MTTIEVHGYVGEVELLYRIDGASNIDSLGILTLGHAQVRHKIGEGIGF